MKYYILLALLACIACQLGGPCVGTPKKRPIQCFRGFVLNEDLPELKEVLEKYRDGDDHEFADYLGDMFDKKDFREGKETNEEEGQPKLLGKCGVHPKYLPYECYEPQVLRRDRVQLKQAFDNLHESDLDLFNEVLVTLKDRKMAYFLPKEE